MKGRLKSGWTQVDRSRFSVMWYRKRWKGGTRKKNGSDLVGIVWKLVCDLPLGVWTRNQPQNGSPGWCQTRFLLSRHFLVPPGSKSDELTFAVKAMMILWNLSWVGPKMSQLCGNQVWHHLGESFWSRFRVQTPRDGSRTNFQTIPTRSDPFFFEYHPESNPGPGFVYTTWLRILRSDRRPEKNRGFTTTPLVFVRFATRGVCYKKYHWYFVAGRGVELAG